MLTVPPMLPSRAEACADFSTSAPEITSAGRTSKARSRPSSSVARMRLLSVTMLYCEPSPRMPTYWPSPPVVRLIDTPVMCRSESATSSSGKCPSSVALMESRTTAASFLMSSDLVRLARIPVMTISSRALSVLAAPLAGAFWAPAVKLAAAAPANQTLSQGRKELRIPAMCIPSWTDRATRVRRAPD